MILSMIDCVDDERVWIDIIVLLLVLVLIWLWVVYMNKMKGGGFVKDYCLLFGVLIRLIEF